MTRWTMSRMATVCAGFSLAVLPPAYASMPQATERAKTTATTQPRDDTGKELLQAGKFAEAIRIAEARIKENPKDNNARLLLVLAQLGAGNEQAAIEQARGAAKINRRMGAQLYYSIGQFYASKKRLHQALIAFRTSWETDNSPEVAHDIGSIYLMRGQLGPAREWLKRTGDHTPDYLNLSRIAMATRHMDDAIKLGRKAIAEAGTNRDAAVSAHLVVGSSQLLNDQLKEARASFETLSKLDASFPASFYLGLVDLAAGDHAGAIAHLSAPPAKVQASGARLLSAVAYHLSGDLKQAELLAKGLSDEPSADALTWLALANVLVSSKQYKAADEAYRKAGNLYADFMLPGFDSATRFADEPAGNMARFTLTRILIREGLFAAALRTAGEALAGSPTTNAFFLVAKATAEAKCGKALAAGNDFEETQKRKPALVSAWTASADCAAEKEDFIRAIKDLSKAVELAPTLPLLRLTLGNLYARNGDLSNAIRIYREMLTEAGNSTLLYNQLAWAMAEKGQDLPQALTYAQKATEQAPNSTEALDTLGWIHYRMGNYDRAMEVYTKVQHSRAADPSIHYHLGVVCEKLGRWNEAAQAFEHALDISDRFPEAADAIVGLKRMRGVAP